MRIVSSALRLEDSSILLPMLMFCSENAIHQQKVRRNRPKKIEEVPYKNGGSRIFHPGDFYVDHKHDLHSSLMWWCVLWHHGLSSSFNFSDYVKAWFVRYSAIFLVLFHISLHISCPCYVGEIVFTRAAPYFNFLRTYIHCLLSNTEDTYTVACLSVK